MGVSPSVRGARTGMSALLQRNASANDELGPVSRFVNHPRSFGSASSLTSWSATTGNCIQGVVLVMSPSKKDEAQETPYLKAART